MVERADRWWGAIWAVFHLVWGAACVADPERWVGVYAASFAALEAVTLYLGRPFTRYVHRFLDWGRSGDTATLAATVLPVLGWCGWFTTLFRDHGWFDPFTNTLLALGFFIYILPHFFGRTW